MDSNGELYELFWENSKFNEANIGEFQKRIEEYSGTEHEIPALQYPTKDYLLKVPNDGQHKQMRQRRSHRKFANRKLAEKQLGSLLGAFSRNKGDGRTFPSAGATYSLEIFCLINNFSGKLNKKACYYNSDNHSLSVVNDLPEWDNYKDLLSIDLEDTMPSVIFVFVLFPKRATVKYGERGGRFALIEAGQAAQNLALRLIQEKMVGVEMGGLLDDKIKELLKLEKTSAQVALGFACGYMH